MEPRGPQPACHRHVTSESPASSHEKEREREREVLPAFPLSVLKKSEVGRERERERSSFVFAGPPVGLAAHAFLPSVSRRGGCLFVANAAINAYLASTSLKKRAEQGDTHCHMQMMPHLARHHCDAQGCTCQTRDSRVLIFLKLCWRRGRRKVDDHEFPEPEKHSSLERCVPSCRMLSLCDID